jgi:hypothetical protein
MMVEWSRETGWRGSGADWSQGRAIHRLDKARERERMGMGHACQWPTISLPTQERNATRPQGWVWIDHRVWYVLV